MKAPAKPPIPTTVALLCVAAVLLPAAAATQTRVSSHLVLGEELRGRGLDPAAITLPFELTESMRRWAHEVAPPSLKPHHRLERLADGLLKSDQLALEYSWGHTGTAIEVFENQRANCLAFTNLFLGMAREVGVQVSFLAVETVANYRKSEDLVVVSDHIAVGYRRPHGIMVFDFAENQEEKTFENLRWLSDVSAIAMFHSNRGAEALQQGDVQKSLNWLATAVELDPELANAWVNLGVSRRRAGDAVGAEEAYKNALELDPRVYSAYQNLAALLYVGGRVEEAKGYERILRRAPTRNPYTFLALGDISFYSGRLDEARRFYRRALSRGAAESYAALGEVAAATGDLRTARKMLRKARKIDLEHQRVTRLARAILENA